MDELPKRFSPSGPLEKQTVMLPRGNQLQHKMEKYLEVTKGEEVLTEGKFKKL